MLGDLSKLRASRFFCAFVGAQIFLTSFVSAENTFGKIVRSCAHLVAGSSGEKLLIRLGLPLESRPTYVEVYTGSLPSDPLNSQYIYVETRYIKQLRDRAHLSPMEVDEIIIALKFFVDKVIREADLSTFKIGADYKSINFWVEKLLATKLEQILKGSQEQFEEYLGIRGKDPDATEGLKRALQSLRSIPGYKAPFAVGVASSLKKAGLYARLVYRKKAAADKSEERVVHYEDLDRELFIEHVRDIIRLREIVFKTMEEEFGLAARRDMSTRRGKNPSLRVPLLSVLRKVEDDERAGLRIQKLYSLPRPPSSKLMGLMRDLFSAVRVLEPPLEFVDEERDILRPDDQRPAPDPAAEMTKLDALVREADFMVSSDIEDVGANHASSILAQVPMTETEVVSDFDRFLEGVSYGYSIQRLRNYLREAGTGMDRSLGRQAKILTKKSSGDEHIRLYRGAYTLRELADFVSETQGGHRRTVVDLKSFRESNTHLSLLQMNEYRHIAETLAKSISERLTFSHSVDLERKFQFVVEMKPAKHIADQNVRVDIFIYHSNIETYSPEEQSAVRDAIQEVRSDLEAKGIPPATLSQIVNISFFPLPR